MSSGLMLARCRRAMAESWLPYLLNMDTDTTGCMLLTNRVISASFSLQSAGISNSQSFLLYLSLNINKILPLLKFLQVINIKVLRSWIPFTQNVHTTVEPRPKHTFTYLCILFTTSLGKFISNPLSLICRLQKKNNWQPISSIKTCCLFIILWDQNYTSFNEMTWWTYIPLAKVWWMEEWLKGLKEAVYVILYYCAIRSTLKFSIPTTSQFTDKAT